VVYPIDSPKIGGYRVVLMYVRMLNVIGHVRKRRFEKYYVVCLRRVDLFLN